MKNLKRSLFAFMLTFSLFAAVDADTVTDNATLDACLNTNNATCVLGNDIVLDTRIIMLADITVTLDLNGHKISPAPALELQSGLIAIRHGSKLTVNDSVGTGAITVGNSTKVLAAIALTYNKTDIDNTKTAELVLNNGKLEGYGYAVTGNGSEKRDNTKFTMNGGSLSTTSEDGHAIYNPQKGDVIINDGTITSCTGIEMRSGNLTVNGGTIKGTCIPIEVQSNGSGTTTNGAGIAVVQHTTKLPINVVINGGTIEGFNALYERNIQGNEQSKIDEVKLSVKGGIFNAINGGTVAVFSENEDHFITGGSFNKELNSLYIANAYIDILEDNRYNVYENKKASTAIEEGEATFKSAVAFDNAYYLVVSKEEKADVEKVTKEVAQKYEKDKTIKDVKLIGLYDISLTDGDQIVEMRDGKFEISIPISEDMRKFDTYKVVYIEDGEIKEQLDAKLIDGKVVFNTTHLSTYGIVGYNNPVIENPNTSDSNIMLILFLALIGGAGVIFSSRKKSVKGSN